MNVILIFLYTNGQVRSAMHAGNARTFSFKQLELLMAKFNLHELLNAERENDATKSVPHRDFYNVRKVNLSSTDPT